MPMGFCAITGGCLTLVGSSPLIMLNDLMESWWLNNSEAVNNIPFTPLGLVSVTPIGIALLIGVLGYFMVFGKKLLPEDVCLIDEDCMDKRLQEIYGSEVGQGYELIIPGKFSAQTLAELQIRPKYHVTVVGVSKGGGHHKNLAPMKGELIEPGDTIWVIGSEQKVDIMSEELGWLVKAEPEVFASENSLEESGIIEGVVIY